MSGIPKWPEFSLEWKEQPQDFRHRGYWVAETDTDNHVFGSPIFRIVAALDGNTPEPIVREFISRELRSIYLNAHPQGTKLHGMTTP